MKKSQEKDLPVTAFVVLALLAEGEAHGYELEKLVWNRGFRFWTDLGRSSIYNALKLLEEECLIESRIESGGGPLRKVFAITKSGRRCLADQGKSYLSNPSHPRSEIDLGIYVLPFLSQENAAWAIQESVVNLEARREFLKERLRWCNERGLDLPALAFERPLLALEAELQWLKKLEKRIKSTDPRALEGWKRYIYKEPPRAEPKENKRRTATFL